MQNHRSFDANISMVDAPRLRRFIANEIAYYNVLLTAFSTRLRTMPALFAELTPEIIKNAVTNGIDRKDRSIPERIVLFLEEIVVQKGNLLPAVRENMACEMLDIYRKLATDMQKQNKMVELLTPMETRTKRNLQVPRQYVTFKDGGISIPYATAKIPFNGKPPAQWDIMTIRDQKGDGSWKVEFFSHAPGYNVRLTDYPVGKKRITAR